MDIRTLRLYRPTPEHRGVPVSFLVVSPSVNHKNRVVQVLASLILIGLVAFEVYMFVALHMVTQHVLSIL